MNWENSHINIKTCTWRKIPL